MVSNYYQLVQALKDVALKQPNIHSVSDTDIYQLNEDEDWEFSHFCVVPSQFTTDYGFLTFTLNLYVVDRLGNPLQIHSEATDLLLNIIKQFREEYDEVDVDEKVVIKPFEQVFKQLTAGCYATVSFTIPQSYCFEDYQT